MKKRLILAATVAACVSVSLSSCQPSEPEYNKQFDKVINDKMYCPPDGNNCAYFKGRNMYLYDQLEAPATTRQTLLNKFYRDAAQNNVRRFFEQENWQTLFPPETLNPTILGEIADANYATLIVPGDSSIMFVHWQGNGMVAENLIFAFKRDAVSQQVSNTLVP
jgi:hypothetical protein